VASITNASSRSENGPTRRRRSSGLGGEIRAGDTSAPALATLDVIPQSPRSIKVR
jgi:acyl-CoA-dependent ceramide synthase